MDTDLVRAFKQDIKSGDYSDTQGLDADDFFTGLKYVKYTCYTIITGSIFGLVGKHWQIVDIR